MFVGSSLGVSWEAHYKVTWVWTLSEIYCSLRRKSCKNAMASILGDLAWPLRSLIMWASGLCGFTAFSNNQSSSCLSKERCCFIRCFSWSPGKWLFDYVREFAFLVIYFKTSRLLCWPCTVLYSTWLWNVARGINGEEVQGRLLSKSHGSGKTFPGPRALKTISSVSISFPNLDYWFLTWHYPCFLL